MYWNNFELTMSLSPAPSAFRRPLVPILVLACLTMASCMKKESFPVTPEIVFEQMILEFDTGMYASRGYLTFSFRDGDGDIGLTDDMTQPPFDTGSIYYYNLFIEYLEKRNGTYVKVDLNPTLNARIPYLTPDDPNKAIRGLITDTLPLNPMPVYDTVKIRFRICDRALHLSNLDSTPPIILKKR